ncbi:MAG: molybdopterin molybdenumtransferase MoeA [Anaerolineales bacterium]|nr:molybdopterin molybdenumtransferase MoeA [Anaerolineales bacterium]
MPEFLQLLPPEEARKLLFVNLPDKKITHEKIETVLSLGRVIAENISAPHSLPEFLRSTVDGYAVRARDTFGASDSVPAYLTLLDEIPMGSAPSQNIGVGQCGLIHTGGMLPPGADAVVMLENTQVALGGDRPSPGNEIEIFRAVADGENVIQIGEDVKTGSVILPSGCRIRPAEIGGLMALGITHLSVAARPKVGLISSGDEIIDPAEQTKPGQVRDINAYTLAALVTKSGGEPILYGIVPDIKSELEAAARRALSECDVVVITAGSSASTRDMTADVIASLGAPGVLVHGINTRPGKPTILGVCEGKAVIGLPGNPVSALVNGYLFVVPVIEKLLGETPRPRPVVTAKLTVNLPSQAGREDWIPVKLVSPQNSNGNQTHLAEPIFGKSNLIFTLTAADGLLRIPPDVTGYGAGEMTEIVLF